MQMEYTILNEALQKYKQMITKNKLSYKFMKFFMSKENPKISIETYFYRICQYSECPDQVVAAGQIIAERTFPNGISEIMIHRVMLISIMLAFKMYIDHFRWKLDRWANIGGIHSKEIYSLEINMLTAIDWRLLITEEEFLKKYRSLRVHKI